MGKISPVEGALDNIVNKAIANTSANPVMIAIKALRDSLFDKQQEVIKDNRTPFTVLCCSRRAGKTSLISRWILMTALARANTEVIYLALSQTSAKRLIWDRAEGVITLMKEYGIEDLFEINHSTLTIKVKHNNTIIYISGANTQADAASWLGHKYALVIIDEAQDFREDILQYLIKTVIIPTLVDHRGRLVLSGTPKALCAGFFYEADQSDEQANMWCRHKWTLFENPTLDSPRKWLDETLALEGLTINDSETQRQFFNRWIREDTAQLFHYLPKRNDFDGFLPQLDDKNNVIRWNYVLGMDIGLIDLTTFVIIAWSTQSPVSYVLECYGRSGILDQEVADIIRSYQIRFGQDLQLIGDNNALAKRTWVNFRQVHKILVKAPEKQSDKSAHIRSMNTQFRLGNIKIDPNKCKELIDQWSTIAMDPESGIEYKKEKHCDFADAALYAWTETYSYVYKPPIKPPTVTEEQIKAWNAEQERAKKRFIHGYGTNPDPIVADIEQFEDLFTDFDD